jgi:hypothetical protein
MMAVARGSGTSREERAYRILSWGTESKALDQSRKQGGVEAADVRGVVEFVV